MYYIFINYNTIKRLNPKGTKQQMLKIRIYEYKVNINDAKIITIQSSINPR